MPPNDSSRVLALVYLLLALLLAACDPPDTTGAELFISAPTESEVAGAHLAVEGSGCPAGMAGGFLLEGIVDTNELEASPGITVVDGFDDPSGRTFVELFIELEPGCYAVAATAAKSVDLVAGTYEVSEHCRAPLDPLEVVVEEEDDGCDGYGGGSDGFRNGGGGGGCPEPQLPEIAIDCDDVPGVALNHPPSFDVVPEDKFGFQCEQLQVCAILRDPNNDPIEVLWMQTHGPALFQPLAVGPLLVVGELDGATQYQQCAHVVSAGPADHAFSIEVFDLLEDRTRIDDALPPDQHSRAALTFPLYTSAGVEAHCVNAAGDLEAIGDPIARADGCEFQTPGAYYCDPDHAVAGGFELEHTCPGGVFDPGAAYPNCED